VSRPTQGRTQALPVRGCHPLWRAVPDASGSLGSATGLVRFRSPLLTESRLMSFPPGTEMFQFPGFASPPYGFRRRSRRCGGLPHSEIRGSKGARPSPRLIAACHVLHRLSVPRHPPDALNLTLDLSFRHAQGQASRSLPARGEDALAPRSHPTPSPSPRPARGEPRHPPGGSSTSLGFQDLFTMSKNRAPDRPSGPPIVVPSPSAARPPPGRRPAPHGAGWWR
jgi:hypothetical protein